MIFLQLSQVKDGNNEGKPHIKVLLLFLSSVSLTRAPPTHSGGGWDLPDPRFSQRET